MKNYKNFIAPSFVIFVAVLTRLFPHAPNFAPIGALALFGGAYLNKRYSIFIIIATMLVSDYLLLYINPFASQWINLSKIYSPVDLLHSSTFYVYASFLIYFLIGRFITRRKSVFTIGLGAFAGSVLFFLITNAAVWINGAYARDLSGLWQSYVMGIPFFRNTLLGDLFYTGAFFASYELIKKLLFKKAAVSN
jgi:hypothetical protein